MSLSCIVWQQMSLSYTYNNDIKKLINYKNKSPYCLCSDYMLLFHFVEAGHTFYSDVVGFSGTTCKNYFLVFCTDQIGNLLCSVCTNPGKSKTIGYFVLTPI